MANEVILSNGKKVAIVNPKLDLTPASRKLGGKYHRINALLPVVSRLYELQSGTKSQHAYYSASSGVLQGWLGAGGDNASGNMLGYYQGGEPTLAARIELVVTGTMSASIKVAGKAVLSVTGSKVNKRLGVTAAGHPEYLSLSHFQSSYQASIYCYLDQSMQMAVRIGTTLIGTYDMSAVLTKSDLLAGNIEFSYAGSNNSSYSNTSYSRNNWTVRLGSTPTSVGRANYEPVT